MAKKYDEVVKAVNEVLSHYTMKLTLRQIYYRLVAKLIIPNRLNEYKYLSKILVKARERGEVDYRKIEDRTRNTHGGDSPWDSGDEYLDAYEYYFKNRWKHFNLSMWGNQPEFIEIWVEKDALTRLFTEVADEYAVKVCPSRGYPSFTYLADAVSRLNELDKPFTILYFGDFDPSGLDIERDLKNRLWRYGLHKLDEFEVERIALTLEQIQEYQLPPAPAKRSDARYNEFVWQTGSEDSVELDALDPPILQDIIRQAIVDHVDTDLWTERIDEADEAREELENKMSNVTFKYPSEDEEE